MRSNMAFVFWVLFVASNSSANNPWQRVPAAPVMFELARCAYTTAPHTLEISVWVDVLGFGGTKTTNGMVTIRGTGTANAQARFAHVGTLVERTSTEASNSKYTVKLHETEAVGGTISIDLANHTGQWTTNTAPPTLNLICPILE